MGTPREISNLGVRVHQRYAESQQMREDDLFKGIKVVSDRAAVNVTTPFFSDELESLLGYKKKRVPWALLTPSKNYSLLSGRLFINGLSRSLGSSDNLTSKMTKMENFKKNNKKLPGRNELAKLFNILIPLAKACEHVIKETSRFKQG